MLAVQRPSYSDTEDLMRTDGWNDDKLERERMLYEGCVRRKMVEHALTLAQRGGKDVG